MLRLVKEQKLECTPLPHLNSHVISSNQQNSIKQVLLTHYILGTATKPVGKKTCYRCFAHICSAECVVAIKRWLAASHVSTKKAVFPARLVLLAPVRPDHDPVRTDNSTDQEFSSSLRGINVISAILPLMRPWYHDAKEFPDRLDVFFRQRHAWILANSLSVPPVTERSHVLVHGAQACCFWPPTVRLL